jgi:hypothetical protein
MSDTPALARLALYQQALGSINALELPQLEIAVLTRLIASGFAVSSGGAISLDVAPTFSAANLTDLPSGDLSNLDADNLTSGTVPDARFPATLPAVSGANLTNLDAGDLASGTVPDARFPATLPAASGVNLTALNASNLGSGTMPDARFPATLPAANGSALTALNASNLASGTVPAARLPTGSIRQVVGGTYSTEVSSSSSAEADTGLTASITPASASNKIIAIAVVNGCVKLASDTRVSLFLKRDATQIGFCQNSYNGTTTTNMAGSGVLFSLDSPATTSALTYKVTFASSANTASVRVQLDSSVSYILLLEVVG